MDSQRFLRFIDIRWLKCFITMIQFFFAFLSYPPRQDVYGADSRFVQSSKWTRYSHASNQDIRSRGGWPGRNVLALQRRLHHQRIFEVQLHPMNRGYRLCATRFLSPPVIPRDCYGTCFSQCSLVHLLVYLLETLNEAMRRSNSTVRACRVRGRWGLWAWLDGTLPT